MRTTISLPDELGQLARNEARQRGISLSAVIRLALESSLRKPKGTKLPWQAIVNDPDCDARSLDGELARGWADHVAGDH